MIFKKTLALICSLLIGLSHAQTWQWANPTLNGPITVKTVDGTGSQSATQNPTGAVVKTNQTAVTAAPVMVVQATAQLPVVVEGAACATPGDQYGTKADLSIMYGCRGGVWTKLDIIPKVVTAGTACQINGQIGQDATGLTLSCQSGTWKQAAGGGGTGLSGIYAPLKNKSTSCNMYAFSGTVYCGTAYAQVDANGYVYTRAYSSGNGNCPGSGFTRPPADTGWVLGFSAVVSQPQALVAQFDGAQATIYGSTTASDGTPIYCSASMGWN